MDQTLIDSFVRIFTNAQGQLIPEVREAVRRLEETEKKKEGHEPEMIGEFYDDPLGR